MLTVNRKLYIFLSVITILFLSIVFYKSSQGLILFGDGNISLWKNNSYLLNYFTWMDNDNGYFMPIMIMTLPFQLIFFILSKIFSIYIVSIIYFYGTIFGLLFSSIYLTKNIFKNAKLIDFIIVMAFSVVNPLVAGIILSQSDIAYSFIFVYLFVGYIFKCKQEKSIEFKDAFILSVLILFINSYILNTVLLFFVACLYALFFREEQRSKYWKNFLVFSLMILMNSFWLFTPAYNALVRGESPGKSVIFYSDDSAREVLSASSAQIKYFSPFMFSHSYIENEDHPAAFFTKYFIVFSSFSITVFVFFVHLLYRPSYEFSERNERKLSIFLMLIFVIFFALSMGTKEPFGKFFLLLWDNMPGFNLFRSLFKFQFVIHFSFVILLILALKKLKKNSNFKIALLIPLLFLSSYYFFDRFFVGLTNPSKVPDYYFENEIALENKKLINTYKVFPDKYFKSKFIYTLFDWNKNQFDSANILRYFTNQTTSFTPFSGKDIDDNIRRQLCNEEYDTDRDMNFLEKILALQNIKHIILQNDVLPSTSSCFNEIEGFKKTSTGKLDIYSVDNNAFLPHFYVPNKLFISQSNESDIGSVLSDENFKINSSVVFSDQNFNKIDLISDYVSQKEDNNESLILEFNKINRTKYRIKIHNAYGMFPLVMSEGYNDGWNAYLSDSYKQDNKLQIDGNYKILEGNEDDQADENTLRKFILNGWISTLGNFNNKQAEHFVWQGERKIKKNIENYQIDYISNEFFGTIQNNNLPKGNIWETWFKKPIEGNHWVANGYANGWMVDTDLICGGNEKCFKNVDGTYDFEFVIEFWPQRLLYIGAGISTVTIVGCLIFLGKGWIKKRKNANIRF
ncbi:MAG: hypothetical protein US63_C0004G0007 [Candidatus Moranbacteria bacterium GW2011_GWC2_37_8]|nr:MAG: hypothetical protein US63_C0004G0007 [Candidatus Moranbacteria bacterium GW2011_GWC2_37_8]KKQ62557.1 MAG: hypothetical protein US82_C0009G0007 [Parcubacteria group bacterium GW2011_GWC1_38_22]